MLRFLVAFFSWSREESTRKNAAGGESDKENSTLQHASGGEANKGGSSKKLICACEAYNESSLSSNALTGDGDHASKEENISTEKDHYL